MQNTGFILINKPSGPTSHDIIYKMRKITGIKKIGHAGTLDPFASGLLIIAIGRESTKKISNYVKLDKEYIATMKLGEISDTQDRDGNIEKVENENVLEVEKIEKVLKLFTGKQKQTPPMFSAKKVNGKRLYKLARKGVEVKREASEIEILSLDLLGYSWPILKIKVYCSTGTYIRTLANDIGKKLGSGAYLEELERTRVGEFDIKNSKKTDELTEETWSDYLF